MFLSRKTFFFTYKNDKTAKTLDKSEHRTSIAIYDQKTFVLFNVKFVIEYLTLKFLRKNIFVTENMEKVKDMDDMMKLVRCKADAMTLSGNGKLV